MTLVIDSSVAACWCFPDEAALLADQAWELLEAAGAAAPSLWWYEIRNVMVVNERRGRITRERTREFLADLGTLPIEIAPPERGDDALRLARKHKLTFYDAAYLELALRLEATLATLDNDLAKAARSEGVKILT